MTVDELIARLVQISFEGNGHLPVNVYTVPPCRCDPDDPPCDCNDIKGLTYYEDAVTLEFEDGLVKIRPLKHQVEL